MDEELIGTYDEMAEKYKPDNIKVLFVGESPPEPKDNGELPYIYNLENEDKNRLWKTLDQRLGIEEEDKVDFLEKFEEEGYFLIDIYPTHNAKEIVKNGNSEDEEYLEMKSEVIKKFSEKLVDLDFEKIVFIHKGGTEALSLPYPGWGNGPVFEKEINEVLE